MATEPITIPAAGEYRIDPDRSTISFATRHLFGLAPVRGTFRLRSGHIRVAGRLADSTARATIAADSFHTATPARDRTIRSARFLDTGNHPDIVFASTGLGQAGDGWVLHGTLTVRGHTRPVRVRVVSLHPSDSGLRLCASARIDRHEFGITAGRGMTGRRLTLTLEIGATAGPR
ncbi:YceI family protein [Actinophytocola sp.]|uniref:YceI family protein n=1 Tax=Actinophytocola sp. TaxID=1872138 RepID=UPI003D6AC7F1